MTVCAISCRAANCAQAADWCKDRREWLTKRFGWPLKGGTPGHDAFGDILNVGDARAFEASLRAWINALALEHGAILITTYRDCARFPGPKCTNRLA